MRFTGQLCVYCGSAVSTKTGDHIFARSLLPIRERGHIPKVPCCKDCNGKKASLEHYLASTLPLASREEGPSEGASEAVRRLKKNLSLSRDMVQGAIRVIDPISESHEETFAFPFETRKLREYANLLAIGLNFHALARRLSHGDGATSHFVTQHTDLSLLWQYFHQMEGISIVGQIGGTGLQYEALASSDEPFISIWRFSFFGGVLFGSKRGGLSNVIWSFLMTDDQLLNNEELFSSDSIERVGEL